MTTQMDPQTQEASPERLEQLLGNVIGDFGAIVSAGLVVIGDKLGLYRALHEQGPLTAGELAKATGTAERYIRHWLVNQAASGYIEYDRSTGRYYVTPEQSMVFAQEDTPASFVGGFTLLTAALKAEPHITEAIRTGGGFHWSRHDDGLFSGTARFFKPGYVASIVQSWLPALEGVTERLEAGATVADVGCGYGTSTLIMARAYPNSRFLGVDAHAPSIEAARREAEAAGLADRVTFQVATAQDFPGDGYDLVTFFDCLHDLGDPVGAASHALQALKPGGTVMAVEPMAGERVEDNLNPVGRLFSAASVLICTPHAIAEGGQALGTIATDSELRDVFQRAGFTSFRRATETPTNRVFEARR